MVRHKLPKYTHVFLDRHGKQRIYFRQEGKPRLSLPGPLYSEAFWIAYHRAKDEKTGLSSSKSIGATRCKSGTMAALIAEYYASAQFTSLRRSTQSTYRNQLERFRLKHGDKPVAALQAKHIDMILGEEASRSRSLASNLRKRLATLMKCATKWGYRLDNPMLYADRVKYQTPGIRSWTDDDIQKFRGYWEDNSPQRIAFEILLYTGLRRSDAVRIGRQHIRDDHIEIGTVKSGNVVQLTIPIHPEFRDFLSRIEFGHMNFIVTSRGAARSEKAFTNWIIAAARKAGLPPQSSPHGVRKAACRTLAETGCTTLEIMAITGHRDIKEVELYCRQAQQKKLAANAIAKRHAV